MDKMLMTFSSEIKGIDEKEGTLTAYVSTKARDRMDEVLLPDGADMRNYKKNPIVLFAHKYDEPPIGKALWIKNDGDGILAKVKFASTEFAQEIFSLFKEGIMNAFSVGFVPKLWEDGDGEKKARRTYTKWEMLEFSAVPVPANPEALALAIQRGLIKNSELKKEFHIKEDSSISVDDAEQKPKPHKNESKDEFMKRCIPQLIDEGKDQDQAAAICYSLWEDKGKNYMEDIKAMEAEIEQLRQKDMAACKIIADLEKEVVELRYKIYELIHKPIPTPEISGEDIAKMISDSVAGEIRRVTGKV